jgi:hypothetical protein
MSYYVLSEVPERHIYVVTGCSQIDPTRSKIDYSYETIKVLRQICRNPDDVPEHPLSGLKDAKDFVEMIINRLVISTTLIIQMDSVDSWRHYAIIGAVLATLGVNYDGITKR